jgi:nucleotide-binding universal stress UspA family protein
MIFESLLFHTRFRDAALDSLKAMLPLAAAGLRRVVMVYVIPREEVAFTPYGGYRKEEEIRLREMAENTFCQWSAVVAAAGIEARWRVATGELNPTLLDIARDEKIDLIVTGRKSRTSFEKIYVGSHVLDLVRRTPVPLLMAKYVAPYCEESGKVCTRVNERMFLRPMLATDWSEPSVRGLDAILALKPVVEMAIVAHIIGRRRVANAAPDTVAAMEAESLKQLKADCARLEEGGITAASYLGRGPTATEIMRVARDRDASLIVMGRTGKDWFQEYWLGGVSHRVAEIAERPVLVIP